MAKVEMYTKAYCPYCMRAKALLADKNIAYQEYKIDQEPNLREMMITRAKGAYTVPQIFIDDQHIGGCDEMMMLDAQGKLDPLLN